MKWLAETTKWSVPTPNHIYLFDDSKTFALAYLKFGEGDAVVFKRPMRIDTRGRTFKDLGKKFRPDIKIGPVATLGRTWTVKGSKGDEYTLTELNGKLSCTCQGFKYRGQCKHTAV